MGMAAGAIGSIAAGAISSGIGGGGGGGLGDAMAIVDEFESEGQGYLSNALRSAIPYTEMFSYQAIETQREMLNRQLDALEMAQKQSREDTKEYYERGQAMTAPYREAGYQAFDTLQDILGMARPESGSSAMYHAMENQAKERANRARMGIQAARTAKDLKMNPRDAFKFQQAAMFGNNLPGLTTALNEYDIRRGGMAGDRRAVYGSPITGQEGGENPWADVVGNSRAGLGQFINRNPSPTGVQHIADFSTEALPINRDLMRALYAQTGSQRSLSQLGNTGYGNITPVSRAV